MMNRRRLLLGIIVLALAPIVLRRVSRNAIAGHGSIDRIHRTEEEWRGVLTPTEFNILRKEGTEPPGSSELLQEKRKGIYVCAGCQLSLFKSEWKYESGTGWPSFWTVMHDHVETKEDNFLFIKRTEYHCARCGGHQGHVFNDGPEPTGERWCNNGAALDFIPEQPES